jgi:predicted Co/Zn/Cd cation transporter (cation efflux family)
MAGSFEQRKAPHPSSWSHGSLALRLFFIVSEGALLITCVCFAFAFAVTVLGRGGQAGRGAEAIVAVLVCLLASGLTAWWMFRRLRALYTKREARAVSITFGVLAPVSLGISLVLAQFSGGYSASLFGNSFGFVGAFAGTVVLTGLLSFALCTFALWFTRRIERIEQQGSSSSSATNAEP